jgi:sugar lactone lactonase YvrE
LLTHVTGCNSDRAGNLYFVNMFGPGIPFTSPSFFRGSVVKYRPGGHASLVAGNLNFPNMAAFGPDGNYYVTTGSICPADGSSPFPPGAPNPCVGGGKVVRINLQHNDED